MQSSHDSSNQRQRNNHHGASVVARPVITHRPPSARPLAVGLWLLAACTLAWLLAAGDMKASADTAPWLILMSWLLTHPSGGRELGCPDPAVRPCRRIRLS